MNSDEQRDEPRDDAQTIPPTTPTGDPFAPYPGAEDPRSRWRIVFGALSLVVGVTGFCLQGMGTTMVLYGHRMGLGGIKMPEPPAMISTTAIVQFVILAGLGVLLIVGAAMLLRRNPLGRKLVLGWVVGRLLMAFVSIALAILALNAQVDWQIDIAVAVRESLAANPDIKPAQLPPIPTRDEAASSAIRGIAISGIFFATWPFVMAIVLTRPYVRDEVESWRKAREAGLAGS